MIISYLGRGHLGYCQLEESDNLLAEYSNDPSRNRGNNFLVEVRMGFDMLRNMADYKANIAMDSELAEHCNNRSAE